MLPAASVLILRSTVPTSPKLNSEVPVAKGLLPWTVVLLIVRVAAAAVVPTPTLPPFGCNANGKLASSDSRPDCNAIA